jgi:hypothetical protein
VVKVLTYGALMGALLTISSVEAAQAADCECIVKPRHHAVTVRHAPAHIIHHASGADAEYAQSYYNYNSTSHVGEIFVHNEAAPVMYGPAPILYEGWQVAPNDAHIRFYHDDRVVYGPGVYPAPPPPPVYYQQSYYGPPAYYYPPAPGVALDNNGWGGGVGYGMADGGGGGGGGGYGGQAFLYTGQGGGQAEPANRGGVNLPSGYGPDYHGNWQGPVVPTAGGGARVGK